MNFTEVSEPSQAEKDIWLRERCLELAVRRCVVALGDDVVMTAKAYYEFVKDGTMVE